MKKLTLTFTVVAVISLMSLAANSANAAGFGWYVGSGPVYPTYPTYPIYYGTGYGGDYHGDVWHDTSHIHRRPATFRQHGNHFHYVPESYEVHNSGHWDHMHW